MNDKPAELLTSTINAMRAAGKNPQQISTELMAGAVANLVDSIGTAETANFLHSFADAVAETHELDNTVN